MHVSESLIALSEFQDSITNTTSHIRLLRLSTDFDVTKYLVGFRLTRTRRLSLTRRLHLNFVKLILNCLSYYKQKKLPKMPLHSIEKLSYDTESQLVVLYLKLKFRNRSQKILIFPKSRRRANKIIANQIIHSKFGTGNQA